jgi:hypothetical protein
MPRLPLIATLAVATLVATAAATAGTGARAAHSQAPQSYRYTFTVTADQGATVKGTGVYDPTARQAQVDVDTSGLPQGTGLPGLGGGATAVLSGGVLYAKPKAGSSWVKVDLNSLAKAQGLSFGALAPLALDPAKLVASIKAASSSVQNLGSAQIGGTSATHLRAQLDIDKALALLPASARTPLRSLWQQAQTSGATLPTVDLWLRADGLPVRVSVRSTGPQAGGTATLDYSGYGAPVKVDVPSGGNVLDLTPLVGALGKLRG